MKSIVKILIAIAILLGTWLIGYVIGRDHSGDVIHKVQTDTLYISDTTKYTADQLKPEEPKKEQELKTDQEPKKDSILVQVRDTLWIHDTLYMSLPLETREYRRDEFYAVVAGYDPRLIHIEVYPKTMVISKTETTTIKQSPWRYSLDVALNYGRMGSAYLAPAIGAELGYKRFTLGADLGLAVQLNNGALQNPNLFWQFGLKYNLIGR